MNKISVHTENGVLSRDSDEPIIKSLARVDAIALGVAAGTLFGMLVFLVTNLLVLKGGPVIGPNLALLSQYFPGYEVTFPGSFIGFVYGTITGFTIGFLVAFLRNLIVNAYLHLLRLKGIFTAVNDHIDNP